MKTPTTELQLVYANFADGTRNLLHVRDGEWDAATWTKRPSLQNAFRLLGVVRIDVERIVVNVH